MNKTRLALIVSAAVLTACGDSSSDSPAKADISAYDGSWQTPTCAYNYDSDTSTDYYTRDILTVADGQLTYTENTYSDNACTLLLTQDQQDLTLEPGDTFSGTDTGLTLQKLVVSDGVTDYHYVGYATPSGNYLILTSNDANTYPDHLTLDEYYVKVGGNFTPSGKTIAVVTHNGINLSDGKVYSDEGLHDIRTIAWSPTYVYPDGIAWGEGIWLDTITSYNDHSYVADMGLTTLDQVTAVPGSWPAYDDLDTTGINEADAVYPLSKGHVYVVRLANDGYAKLRVLNTPDPDSFGWQILVEYQLM